MSWYIGDSDCDGKFFNHGVDSANGGVFWFPGVTQVVDCGLIVEVKFKVGCLKGGELMHFSDRLKSFRNNFGFPIVDRGVRRKGKIGIEDW